MSQNLIAKSTYRKANWALGITTLGLIAAYPYQANFWGGLLTSGCSAGLVGGLADWFAVTALFRKPLGIRPGKIFRTEIIPRNRKRIFDALAHMVQDELLSQEALTQKIALLDFATFFEGLMAEQGLERLKPSLNSLTTSIMGNLELRELEPFWRRDFIDKHEERNEEKNEEEDVRVNRLASSLSEIIRDIYRLSVANGSVERVLEELAHQISLWVQSPEMHRVLMKWIDDALTDYVNENPSRKIVQMFLPDTAELTARIQVQLVNYLMGGQAVRAASEWIEGFVRDSRLTELIKQALPGLMRQGEKTFLPHFQAWLQAPESAQELTKLVAQQLENYRLELREQAAKRVMLNQRVQTLLSRFVEKQHDRIGRFVLEGLEKYTDEMLVEMLEAKAGADLQMIRINGSVVGALAGMLFYVVNFLL